MAVADQQPQQPSLCVVDASPPDDRRMHLDGMVGGWEDVPSYGRMDAPPGGVDDTDDPDFVRERVQSVEDRLERVRELGREKLLQRQEYIEVGFRPRAGAKRRGRFAPHPPKGATRPGIGSRKVVAAPGIH